jgi:chloramphenicol 3-O phosphotransferase
MTRRRPPVIFLNGASSSGKGSLAGQLQVQLAEHVFIHLAEDMYFNLLPAEAWQRSDFLDVGRRLYDGFARSVAAMAGAGNRVIVDTVGWNPGSLETFVGALADTDVLAVGVHCDLEVLEQRERSRGDRSAGLARRQLPLVHLGADYDVEVDTSAGDIAGCTAQIVAGWNRPPRGRQRVRPTARGPR